MVAYMKKVWYTCKRNGKLCFVNITEKYILVKKNA